MRMLIVVVGSLILPGQNTGGSIMMMMFYCHTDQFFNTPCLT